MAFPVSVLIRVTHPEGGTACIRRRPSRRTVNPGCPGPPHRLALSATPPGLGHAVMEVGLPQARLSILRRRQLASRRASDPKAGEVGLRPSGSRVPRLGIGSSKAREPGHPRLRDIGGRCDVPSEAAPTSDGGATTPTQPAGAPGARRVTVRHGPSPRQSLPVEPGRGDPMPDAPPLTALDIARRATLLPITEVAAGMGIGEDLLQPYGRYVAKVSLDAVEVLADRPRARYVVVTAITPTPLGEGKTTTTLGLAQGLSRDRPAGHRGDPPVLDGSDVRDQGRGRRRRLQPGRPLRGVQPPSDRGHACGHGGPQHPLGHRGQPPAPWQRARSRPPRHLVAPGARRQRPGPAQHRDRTGHGRRTACPASRVSTSPRRPR